MKRPLSSFLASTVTYFIMLVLFVLVRIIFLYVNLPFSQNVNDFISTVIIQGGIMLCLAMVLYSFFKKQNIKTTLTDFRFEKISFYTIILCIFIGILCYVLNIFVSSFFGTIISLFGFESAPSFPSFTTTEYSVGAFIFQVITVAILPGICEEVAHRGLLLKGLSSLGIMRAAVFSSVLFGLMHLNISQFFYATVLGYLISLSVIISKSIFPAMIIHFMNNFLSIYFTFAQANNWALGGGIKDFLNSLLTTDNPFSFFLICTLILSCLFMLLVYLFTLLLKETRIKKVRNMLQYIVKLNNTTIDKTTFSKNDENLLNMQMINKLMGEYNIKSLNNMVFTDIESKGTKLVYLEKIFLIGCVLLGSLVTLSTFIWGLI